jgi:hypothetical protein
MVSTIFDEKLFIYSIISEINNFNEIEEILKLRYDEEIGFNSEKEAQIYALYEKSFIIKKHKTYYSIKIPTIKSTYINCKPSLFNILLYYINIEIINNDINDANTEVN